MTTVEIPDPLWEIRVDETFNPDNWREPTEITCYLMFCDIEVYSLLYSERDCATIFAKAREAWQWDADRGREVILDDFKGFCARGFQAALHLKHSHGRIA